MKVPLRNGSRPEQNRRRWSSLPIAIALWIGAAWLAGGGGQVTRAETSTPIFVTIVMHSEQNERYDTNANLFEINRTNLFRFAQGLFQRRVKFNFQSDWTFLTGVTNFDHGHPETSGTNIIVWMQNDLGFEIDPHNHIGQSTYNYADVAALITACGAHPSTVAGGFIALPKEDNEWPVLQQTITGAVYTATTWKASALWGSGTAGHVGPDQTNLWFSGIYCPMDTNHFYTHQPGNPPLVGGYGGRNEVFTNLDMLIARRDSGRLCTGTLYSVNLMANMAAMNPPYILNFLSNLDRYTNVPNLRFVGISELTNSWATEYASDPSYLPWNLEEDLDEDQMNDGWEITNFCGIVDSDGLADFDEDGQPDRNEYVAGTSPTNETDLFKLTAADSSGEITWTAVSGRIYEVEVDSGTGWEPASSCITGTLSTHTWTNPAPLSNITCRVHTHMP